MVRATSYDELIKGYYGGRHCHHHAPLHHGHHRRGRQLDSVAERLFATYYGHAHHRKDAQETSRVAVSFSSDDRETLERAPGPAGFEEYVVSASLSEDVFEEYVVARSLSEDVGEEYVVERSPVSHAASLRERRSDQSIDPRDECELDISDPFGSHSKANSLQPPEEYLLPAAAATPNAPHASEKELSTDLPSSPLPDRKPRQDNAASASDDDFMSDMQAILTRQKVYDPVAKKMIDADQVGRPAAAEPSQGQGSVGEQASNSQAIFDKIAQSMQYANKYDLGTVELENRFADFDRISDLQQRSEAKKPAAAANDTPPQAGLATATAADTQDFIQDLDAMQRQRGAAAAPRSDVGGDPFAFLPPSPDDASAAIPASGGAVSNASTPGLLPPGGMGAPTIPIPAIQLPSIQIPTIQAPGLPTSASLATSTSSDVGGESSCNLERHCPDFRDAADRSSTVRLPEEHSH